MIQLSGQEEKTIIETHFGFRETPFGVTPDPRFFYNEAAYMRSLAALAYGIKAKKGLMLVTGEVGTGKTILLRKLMCDLEATVKFVFVSSSDLSSDGLLPLVAHELGLAKRKSRFEVIQELRGHLLEQIRNGNTVALLIDDAQNLSDRALESLCSLSNLETDNEKLLQIVLVGQPELMTTLSKFSLRQIKQRIAIQHRLSGLQTLSEVEHYIRQRLQVAGYNGPEIFTKEALEAIFRYSSGSPRLVNMICDNSLALVCEAGDRNVSATVATKAASGFQLEREVETPELVASELAVVPMATLDQKAEANQARLEMDDRVEPAAVSLQSSEPTVIPPTVKAKSPPVSTAVSDKPTNGAAEIVSATGAFSFNDQIAPSHESRDTWPRKKNLTELLELVRQGNEGGSQKRIGLRWKVAGLFSGVMLILCALMVAAVYHLTQKTLREQFEKRALTIATNLSEASAGHIVGKNLLELNTLLQKYTFLDGLAYAFVQNSEGAIVAHTLGTFPPELHQGLPVGRQRVANRRELSLQEKPIYETSVPVLDGQVGTVHVGFWGDAMEKEIQSALLPLMGIIAIVPILGAVLSFLMAHWIVRPISRLTEVAERITKGDLQTSGEYPKSRDEIGDLARSLERMRASLRAAMARLGHESS
jgi:type II secretory pathway predicted ATPase ExeA/HAMP domain-containing protein